MGYYYKRYVYTYGISGVAYELFFSYLADRSQIVKIGSCVSNEEAIKIGIPQGSV